MSKTGSSNRTRSARAKPKETTGQYRIISENRKARYRFEILEQLECGVVLLGTEVKSLRENRISLDESYVRLRDGALWLVGADIPEYRQANIWNHDPKRSRKLLVRSRELRKLSIRSQEKGLTLIPLRVYFNTRGLVKIVVGVGRGKKLHDKRESIKKADLQRQLQREMRSRR